MSIYKRSNYRRRDTLTGGTKDVNPQFMNLKVNETAANTFTQVAFPIPIQRLQNQGRAQVMEVLKVFAEGTAIDTSAAAQTLRALNAQMTTKSFTALQSFAEPTLFWRYNKEVLNSFTAGGTGLEAIEQEPRMMDLTDGAGHGILIASDNIYLAINCTNYAAAAGINVKILYRWKDVTIQEYVGIVQSQQ